MYSPHHLCMTSLKTCCSSTPSAGVTQRHTWLQKNQILIPIPEKSFIVEDKWCLHGSKSHIRGHLQSRRANIGRPLWWGNRPITFWPPTHKICCRRDKLQPGKAAPSLWCSAISLFEGIPPSDVLDEHLWLDKRKHGLDSDNNHQRCCSSYPAENGIMQVCHQLLRSM